MPKLNCLQMIQIYFFQTCSQVFKVQVQVQVLTSRVQVQVLTSRLQVQVQVQVTEITAYIRRNSETAAMLTSIYEALWFSVIILSIKSVNEILSFGHCECFLPDTLSVTHYSKLTVQYHKNVSNTVASSAVNVTYCTLEIPMTITVCLTF